MYMYIHVNSWKLCVLTRCTCDVHMIENELCMECVKGFACICVYEAFICTCNKPWMMRTLKNPPSFLFPFSLLPPSLSISPSSHLPPFLLSPSTFPLFPSSSFLLVLLLPTSFLPASHQIAVQRKIWRKGCKLILIAVWYFLRGGRETTQEKKL